MGDANRKKAESEKRKSRTRDWFSALQDDEKIVAEVAIATFEKIVAPKCNGGDLEMKPWISAPQSLKTRIRPDVAGQ